ncbi:MAG TPA: hypothetical protein H9830_14455 [Candidatus Agrococcus pullicola]|uniref:DUF559 domain-containing protein n=1 Tax=Candidatus Agrococcus pullicola TaxID=2838429 RepID=A0A9D1YXA9_9MICO|nr:hypothetical protein [Candidatus Agrococcus pullicola]
MARHAADLPEELGEVFTLAEAVQAGVSPQRLRRRDIRSLFRGVYQRVAADHESASGQGDSVVSEESTHVPPRWQVEHLERAKAFSRMMRGKPWFFSGVTAALIWGMPIPSGRFDQLEIGVYAPQRPPERRGVRGVQVRTELADVQERRGVRLTSPASTWVMLGSRLPLRDLVACGDALIHRDRIPGTNRLGRPPMATLEELCGEVARGRRRGVRLLRAALPLLRTGSASPPETHTRLLLRDAGLPEPELDYDVFGSVGQFLGCSEIAFPDPRVALEYESEHHRVSRHQWNRDIEKYRAYAEVGWQVVRVTSELLYRRPRELIRQVRGVLHCRPHC